ncbi:MAG: 6-bladed beta-propeller [Nitrospirota bacterium]|nr:6-bladed beta-propeller [Nitrospirota bacterium]
MKQFPSTITVLVITCALITGAPALLVADEPAFSPAQKTWVWPQYPEKPRIKFLQTVITPADLGVKKGFFAKLWEFIAGEDTVERIQSPHGVVADGEGKIYVADWGAGIIHYFNFEKKKYDSFSKTKLGPLVSPIGVALDADGLLYVTDSYLRRVFVFNGSKNKRIIGDESLGRPTGIAINKTEKRIYIVDTLWHRVDVFNLEGTKLFSFGAHGAGDGEFNYPTHIALDRTGDVYVMDSLNFRVQIFDRDGKYLTQFGGTGTGLRDFLKPKGVSVDSEGHVWVSDSLRNSIQVFDRQGRLLLIFGRQGNGPGQFDVPAGLFMDSKDRLIVADSYNYRIQLFQYLKAD